MSLYKDPILQAVYALIDAADGGAITTYHYGDPLFLPKSDLPALIGQVDRTEVTDVTNAEDEHRIRYVLTVVTDIRADILDPQNATDNIHYGYQKLQKIFEERNADFTLKSTAIMKILRANANLGNNSHIDLTTLSAIDYGFTFGLRGERTWSWEGTLTFDIYFSGTR